MQRRPGQQLGQWDIFVFWSPLAVMWIMMAVEQPAMAAVIARLPDATANLAAFGVAFSVALVIESPILQLLSAATALAGDRLQYRRLLSLMHLLAAVLTALHLLVAATPLYALLVGRLLGVPDAIVELSRVTFLAMLPFTAAVGYRRLWQGVLIRYGRTAVIPATMLARLLATGAVLAAGYTTRFAAGALVAAVALIAGVTAGALAAFLYCRPVIRRDMPVPEPGALPMSWRSLLHFYVPLSVTSVVFLASQPLLTFGMARSAFPLQSLAVWPVINGFMFLFNSPAISYQEAVIALLGRGSSAHASLRRFSFVLGISVSLFFLLVALTPAGEIWFRGVAGLSAELLPFTRAPLRILWLIPALITAKSWFRGRLVHYRRTSALAHAVAIHSLVLLTAMLVGPVVLRVTGTLLAALGLCTALGVEAGYLRLRMVRHKRSG
ncbi:MAG: hypothetical protein EA384_01630 [Spirochaetaceae bacterium]|nr:MAG: hypothetical protein EA384_01630 [Spirochaetaceae bacterium]